MRYILLGLIALLLILTPISSVGQTFYKFGLEVSPYPLPADGGSYPLYITLLGPDGVPVKAPEDITVYLYSSDPRIVSLERTVMLPKGSYYIKTYINTSRVEGTVLITAAADGVEAGTLEVETAYPYGEPVKIGIYSRPSVILPFEDTEATLIVQLEDGTGHPVKADKDILVRLTLSDNDLADVPSSVVIKEGTSKSEVKLKPKGIAGTLEITASAVGYEEGSCVIEIKTPQPSSLMLYPAPEVLPADGISIGYVAIMLVDDEGYPALAEEDVTVYLSSSNNTVAFFSTNKTVIKRGEYYTVVTVNTTGLVGTTTLTAHAEGLNPSSAMISTSPLGTYSFPNKLELYVIPDIFLPDEKLHKGVVVVQLLNGTDYPIILYSDIVVTLSSSEPRYGDVSRYVTVKGGSNIGVGDFYTGHITGFTQLTVTADGFEADYTMVSVESRPPKVIRLEVVPPILKANEEKYDVLVVQLMDEFGNPVRAINETEIFLLPSDETLIEMPYEAYIEPGKNYVVLPIKTTKEHGEATIFAHSTNLKSGEITVNIQLPYPNTIDIAIHPSMLIGDGGIADLVLWIEGYDVVAKLDRSVNLSLFSTNSTIISVKPYVFFPIRTTYRETNLQVGEGMGEATVYAIADGFEKGEASVYTYLLPMEVVMSSTATFVVGRESPINLTTRYLNYGVPNAVVNVTSATGKIRMVTYLTDENGSLTFYYTPEVFGTNEIEAYVKAKGFEEGYGYFSVEATAYPNLTIVAQTYDGKPIEGVTVRLTYPNGTVVSGKTDTLGRFKFANLEVGNYTIQIDKDIQIAVDKMFSFDRWSDDVTTPERIVELEENLDLIAHYKTKYFVLVNSLYATVTGTGWYDEGSVATISVSPLTIQISMLTPPQKFSHWSGDIYSKEPTTSFIVDSPKVINAVWEPDYVGFAINLSPLIVILLVIISIPIIIWRRMKRRKVEEVEEEFL